MNAAWKVYRHDIEDYMTRWVLQTPWGTIRLHRIRREDADPDPHDHPWSFVSLILWGGYREERPYWMSRWLRRGQINRFRAASVHRIVEVLPNTWTLVVSGRKVRSWGFHTPDGVVPWREYLGLEVGP